MGLLFFSPALFPAPDKQHQLVLSCAQHEDHCAVSCAHLRTEQDRRNLVKQRVAAGCHVHQIGGQPNADISSPATSVTQSNGNSKKKGGIGFEGHIGAMQSLECVKASGKAYAPWEAV